MALKCVSSTSRHLPTASKIRCARARPAGSRVLARRKSRSCLRRRWPACSAWRAPPDCPCPAGTRDARSRRRPGWISATSRAGVPPSLKEARTTAASAGLTQIRIRSAVRSRPRKSFSTGISSALARALARGGVLVGRPESLALDQPARQQAPHERLSHDPGPDDPQRHALRQ